jgi:hypothetical protein
MATRYTFQCPACKKETKRKETLFGALRAVSEQNLPVCYCGASTTLHLSFDFALNASGKNSVVLASFYPDPLETWLNSFGRTVTFYPFLVVTKREGRDQAVWLPYWHGVRDGEKERYKYGQWAPFMDMELFEDLLTQARNAGFLNSKTHPPVGKTP